MPEVQADPAEEGKDVHPVERVHLASGSLSFRHLLIDAAMIVFSVLLALSLESWHERHAQRELARHALENIRAELTYDLSRIDAGLVRHQEVVDHLSTELAGLDAGTWPKAEEPLYPTALYNSAWTAAMSTGTIAHMDLATVQAASRFYEINGWKDRIEDSWIRLMTTSAADKTAMRQRLTSLQYLARTYMEVEQELKKAAEEALKAIPAR